MTQTFLADCDTRIDASPESVFGFFVDPDQMVRWMGIRAELDPVPGGRFFVEVTPGWIAEGTYVELDPPRAVSFTWGWSGGDAPVEPGSTLVEVTLEPDGDGTVLHLRHSGMPSEESRAAHLEGWTHYFERLVVAATGGDPGRDPWLGPEA